MLAIEKPSPSGPQSGIQLLWSHLKHPDPRVKAAAAAALSPCLDHEANLRMVQDRFVISLPLLTKTLTETQKEIEEQRALPGQVLPSAKKSVKSDAATRCEQVCRPLEEVQANVCAMVGNCARSPICLGILTQQGLLEQLAKLCKTRHEELRKNLAYAIANCSPHGDNCRRLGSLGCCTKLVEFLRSPDHDVRLTTSLALMQLSLDSEWWRAAAHFTCFYIALLPSSSSSLFPSHFSPSHFLRLSCQRKTARSCMGLML